MDPFTVGMIVVIASIVSGAGTALVVSSRINARHKRELLGGEEEQKLLVGQRSNELTKKLKMLSEGSSNNPSRIADRIPEYFEATIVPTMQARAEKSACREYIISAKDVVKALGYDTSIYPLAFDKKVYRAAADKIEELLKGKCLQYSRSWQWNENDSSSRFRIKW